MQTLGYDWAYFASTYTSGRSIMEKSNVKFAVFGRLFLLLFLVLCVNFVFLTACDNADKLFVPEEFSIILMLNNGESNIVWKKGDDMPEIEKDGYVLVGWCYDEKLEGEVVRDLNSIELKDNLTLYAKWAELKIFEGISFENSSVIYDGNKHSIAVNGVPSGANVAYVEPYEFVDCGEYSVSATVSMEGYKTLELNAVLTIQKATASEIKFEDGTFEEDGAAHYLYAEGVPSGITVTYEGNGKILAGEYCVTASFDCGKNYNAIADMTAKLTISEKTHTVTFCDEQGERAVVVGHGKAIDNIPTPRARDGYVGTWDIEDFSCVTSDLTVRAAYSLEQYTIKYMDGDECVKSGIYTLETAVVLEACAKEHYVFTGWYDNAVVANGNRVDKIEKGSVGDVTVYATWTPVEYALRFELNGGTNNAQNASGGNLRKYTVEDEFELFAPTRAYYVFAGWYLNDRLDGSAINRIDKGSFGNITAYAKWIPQEFDIVYNLNGGVCDGNHDKYNIESEFELIDARKTNYEFLGWFDNEDCKYSSVEAGMTGNLSLNAKWKPIEYSLILRNVDGATTDCPATFNVENDRIYLSEAVKPHYEFCGWYADAACVENRVEYIEKGTTHSVVLYAKWSAKRYNITYICDGENTQNPTFYTIESENIVLVAPIRDDYTFDGWRVSGGEEYVTVIPKGSHGDIELVAVWTKIIPFTVVGNKITTYTGNASEVTVPSRIGDVEIKEVESGAFADKIDVLTSLIFEDGIEKIGENAFSGAKVLKTLSLPSTLTEMYKGMLADCERLEKLTLPFCSFVCTSRDDESASRYAADSSSNYVYGLSWLFSEESEKSGCYEVVEYVASLKSDGSKSVAKSGRTAYLPSSLNELVVLGGDLIDRAFSQVTSLERVTLGSQVEIVGNLAFYGCGNLKSIAISGEFVMGSSCLAGCTSLVGVSVCEQMREYMRVYLDSYELSEVAILQL